MYNLGNMYANGKGVDKDMRRATELYKMAAEKGHVNAQYWYGYCLYTGEGVFKADKEEGLKWIKKSANQGNELANRWLRSVWID